MPKYDVTLYPIIMVRFSAVEANTPEAACEKAKQLLDAGKPAWPGAPSEWIDFEPEFDEPACVDLLDENNEPIELDLLLMKMSEENEK